MRKQLGSKLGSLFLAGAIVVSSFFVTVPTGTICKETVSAASFTEYPAELTKLTVNGNRNLTISGDSDGAAITAQFDNGTQKENWRLDYVVKGVYRIVNMGNGKVLSTEYNGTSHGTKCVIAPYSSSKAQYWNITPVATDSLGNTLTYKITNYLDSSKAVTFNSSNSTVTLENYSGTENQRFRLNTAGLQGFAAAGKQMNGQEKGATTGGILGETVFVDSYRQLSQEVSGSEPKTIVITKDLSYDGSWNYDSEGRRYPQSKLTIGNNKTIIGSYAANRLHNVYINAAYQGQGQNIILRNITISHDSSSNHINTWEFSKGNNLWLDHITFVGHSSINNSNRGGDIDKLLSIVGTYDYATVSDCSFGKHEYGVILGYPEDTDQALNTYKGKPCVSLMTNYFNSTITRAPGLMRYGYFHSMNNYVYDFHLAYTMHTGANIFTEKNYYDGAGNIGSVVNDDALNITSISNPSVYKVGPWYTDSGSIAVRCYQNNNVRNIKSLSTSWRPSNNYSYVSINANNVPNYCRSNAGAKNSRTAMTYATFAEAGVPIASYLVTGQAQTNPSPSPSPSIKPSPSQTTTPTQTPWPTPTPSPTATPKPSNKPSTTDVLDISGDGNSWTGGYSMNLTLKNTSSQNISNWSLTLDKSQVDVTSMWCAKYQVVGNQIIISPESYNQAINQGGTVTFGFCGNGSMPSSLNYTFVYTQNNQEYRVQGTDSSL